MALAGFLLGLSTPPKSAWCPLETDTKQTPRKDFHLATTGPKVRDCFRVARESPSKPCNTPAENYIAGSRQSCGHQCDRSFSWPPRWPAASADAPPSLRRRAEADDRRSRQ